MQHFDVIIIGGGVAGMSAALYLNKANLSCCIFEKDVPGGIINYTHEIENFPGYTKILGSDLAYNIYSQLQKNDIPFVFEDVEELKLNDSKRIIKTANSEYEADYIIIATGRKHKNLNIPGEAELERKGISYCAVCDGNLYKNDEVIVVGGGNSAFQATNYLSKLCKKVTLIHRSENFRGENSTLEKLKDKENVIIKTNANIKEFKKDENGNLSGVILDNGEQIPTRGCFICIGFEPSTKMFESLNITNEDGYIIVDNNMETNLKGIYAIGDVREHSPCQIVPAMSDGVVAALNIINNSK